MRALLVYESMFGNTALVADAIGQGLGTRMEVTLARIGVGREPDPAGFDLLVVGAPTHAMSLPVPDTRRQAAAQTDAEIDTSTGVREFLTELPASPDRAVAVFDTRHRRMRYLPGSAARAAARLLGKAGWRVVVAPQSFYVAGVEGPLLPGELDRAADWGEQIARLVVLTTTPAPEPRITRA